VLNPRGVLFGPNASLDVSGSFHVSTADYLRLADGATFHTDLSHKSVLTVAPPAAFGFLAQTPAGISIQESELEVPEGRSLSLVGGDVRIVGGVTGALQARSGQIGVVSVASPGEVAFDPATQIPDIPPGSFSRLGRIDLVNQAFLNTTGSPSGTGGGGTISIRGGRLVMTGASELRSATLGDVNGAPIGIDVRIAGDAIVDNSDIQTTGLGAGRAGDVIVTARTLAVQNDGGIRTDTGGTGAGGNLMLDLGQLTVTSGGEVATNTDAAGAGGALTLRVRDAVTVSGRGRILSSRILSSTDGTGPGGSVTVSASALSIDGGRLGARTSAAGSAGHVLVEVDRLRLTGASDLSGFSSGAGQAGSVTVTARESVSLAQGSRLSSTVDESASGTPGRTLVTTPALRIDDAVLGGLSLGQSMATAGDVEVRASQVALVAGGQISASAVSTGGGGTISIVGIDPQQPADMVSLAGSGRIGRSRIATETTGRGNAGRVLIAARSLRVDGGAITSNTSGAGHGGDIELHVGTMTLTGPAVLSSSTGEEATRRGGSIAVTARDTVSVTANALVMAASLGSGDAGRISIAAPSLRVEDGAGVTTLTSGSGRAGSITVDVVGNVVVRGATIDSTTFGAGSGGDVELRARSLELSSGAQLSARSESTSNAGSIRLTATDTILSEHSTVTAEATQADGGNILVTAAAMVRLRDSRLTATVGGGPQTVGGNVTIDPQFVVLQNSQIVANAFEGRGGNIRIQAQQVFLADPASLVSASSTLGINGQVAIQAPVTSLSGAVAPLPQSFARATELLQDRCVERLREGTVSRFVLGGRDGVPLEPGSLLLSPLVPEEQPGPVPRADTGAGQREAAFVHVGGLEMPNTGVRYLRGTHAPTRWLGALDMECAK
jgi:large exoprotein involved in heme utilization and adhesion